MSGSVVVKTIKTPRLDIEYLDLDLGSPAAQQPPAILLHGWPDSFSAWKPFFNLLTSNRRALKNGMPTRFIAPNLRACGNSNLPKGAFKTGQQAALALDLVALLDALKIPKAYLLGMDWGGRAAVIVSAVFPERCAGLCTMGSGYNLQVSIRTSPDVHLRPLSQYSPDQERRWWYQYYLHSQRGYNALKSSGTRKAFQGALWKEWSPNWKFTEQELEEADKAWSNPDFPDVVIQSYRHRHDSTAGDPDCEWLEEKLAPGPVVTVPTMILHGQMDGIDPYFEKMEPAVSKPANQTYGSVSKVTPSEFNKTKFVNPRFEKRTVWGVGHFIPEEAPEAVLDALEWLVGVESAKL